MLRFRLAARRLAVLLAAAALLAACGATPPASTGTQAEAPTAVPVVAGPTAAPAATSTAAPAEPTAAPAAASTAAPAADPRAGWPETFRLGLFGGDDAEEVLQTNEPLRLHLEKALGIPVEVFTGTSYSAVIEAMRADRVDGMSVGPFAYILAVQEAQAEALAVGVSTRAEPAVYDPTISPYYFSVIFTKKGSGIATVQDLIGKDFSFVDPASTSGHLIPKTYLKNNGIDADKQMNTIFAGSHPTSAEAVWNGKVAAGAATIVTLYNLAEEGSVQFCAFEDGQLPNFKRTPDEIKARYDSCPDGSLVIIAQSDPIPNTPFAVRSNLPDSFKQAVKEALLSVKDDPELVATFKRWFLDPTAGTDLASLDQFYNPLRDAAKLLDLDLQELANQG